MTGHPIASPIGHPIASDRVHPNRPRIARVVSAHTPSVGHPSIVGLGPRADSTGPTLPGAWMAADAASIGGGH